MSYVLDCHFILHVLHSRALVTASLGLKVNNANVCVCVLLLFPRPLPSLPQNCPQLMLLWLPGPCGASLQQQTLVLQPALWQATQLWAPHM